MRNIVIREPSDPSPFASTPFFIENENNFSPQLALHRILAGTASIIRKNSDGEDIEIIDQNINYFLPSISANTDRSLNHLMLEENFNIDEYFTFAHRESNINKIFYENIYYEICNALIEISKDQHLKSFIFIYRAYEHISYAFPMIYAQNTQSYENTFEDLKKWLSSTADSNVGEMRFKEKFLNSSFPPEELDATYTINLTGTEREKREIFQAITENCLGWGDPQQFSGDTKKYEKIDLEFKYWNKLLIGLRNRFFHLSNNGNKNILSKNLSDPDQLFSQVTKFSINYISRIFLIVHLSKYK